MELSAYIRLVRRWLWLIILAVIISGSAAFVAARTQPPIYRASTTIQLGNYLNLTDPNPTMIQSAAALAQTYITLLKTTPIMQAVVDKLKLPFPPEKLESIFEGRITQGTSFLTLTVTYTDPVIAADVANELAAQLIANSPTELTRDQQEQLAILQNEIRQAQTQLEKAREELKTIDDALDNQTVNEQDAAILTARRAELITEINATQSNLATMTSTIVQLQQRGTINFIRVIEPARVPTETANPNPINNTLVAAAVGAVLALGAAFLLEYLNDSLRSPAEVMPILNVPLLGAVAPFGNKRSYKNKLITWMQPRSTISEAYRALRVNILFRESNAEDGCRVYMVTSPGPSEGKSITVANLGITFAMTGMRVLIIDGDMRRPAMHQIFHLPNVEGLSSVWRKEGKANPSSTAALRVGQAPATAPGKAILNLNIQLYLSELIQKTEIPNLSVLTSGLPPANPAELLDTPQMRELTRQLSESEQYDVVLFDTPPVLVVSDASVIANVARAKGIVVVESGRTRRGAAVRAVQQLTTLSVPILGVIMNRLRAQDRDAGYGYYYYYGYTQYGPNATHPPQIGPGSNNNGQGRE